MARTIEEIKAEAFEFYQDLKDNLENELQELKSIRKAHLEKVNEAIDANKEMEEEK